MYNFFNVGTWFCARRRMGCLYECTQGTFTHNIQNHQLWWVSTRGESIYRYVLVYVCQAIYDTLFWQYANIRSGLKIALLIVGLEVQNSIMSSKRKQTNFENIQRRKSTMLPNVICILTSCNIWLKTNITVHHQCHNKFVTKSAKCHMHMQNLLNTSVPWLFSDVFDLFHRKCLNKLFIQYIRYRN